MKRKPVKRKTIIGLMHDPDPRYVSLVPHGANQRGFHATKMDGKDNPMPKRDKSSKGSTSLKIHRVLFSPDQFDSVDAVKEYMQGKGYEDFTVEEADGGGFLVVDEPADSFKSDLRTVESSADAGVSFEVGDVEEGTAKADTADAGTDTKAADKAAEGDEQSAKDTGTKDGDEAGEGAAQEADNATDTDTKDDAPKSEEAKSEKDATHPVRKRTRKGVTVLGGLTTSQFAAQHENFADAVSTEKGAKSFADTVNDYSGGVPPGMWVMVDAMMTELRKMLKGGKADETSVKNLAGEFASGVMAMHAAYETIVGDMASKSAEDDGMAELDALLDVMFGSLTETPDNSEVSGKLDKLLAAVGETAKGVTGIQTTLETMAAEGEEPSTKDAGDDKTPVTIPDRKSANDDEAMTTLGLDAENAVKEAEEDDRRAMKRLGFAL